MIVNGHGKGASVGEIPLIGDLGFGVSGRRREQQERPFDFLVPSEGHHSIGVQKCQYGSRCMFRSDVQGFAPTTPLPEWNRHDL